MMAKDVPVQYVQFAVVDRPACVWGLDIEDDNLRFLKGFDPTFFLYQAEAHSSPPDKDSRSHAALALRLNYGMAVEALFALLGAVVQAPDCVFGWLSLYKNEDLRELVGRVTSGKSLRTLQPFRPCTWETISSVLLSPLRGEDAAQHATFTALFAKSWAGFAEHLLSAEATLEYNSLKHSFRVQPCGFTIDVSHQGASILKSESELGHAFPYVKQMAGRKMHFDVKNAAMSLEPEMSIASLKIISCSINNAIAFARDRAGDKTSDLKILLPDLELFQHAWQPKAPIASFTTGGSIAVPENEYGSKEQILSVYDDLT